MVQICAWAARSSSPGAHWALTRHRRDAVRLGLFAGPPDSPFTGGVFFISEYMDMHTAAACAVQPGFFGSTEGREGLVVQTGCSGPREEGSRGVQLQPAVPVEAGLHAGLDMAGLCGPPPVEAAMQSARSCPHSVGQSWLAKAAGRMGFANSHYELLPACRHPLPA